MFGCKYSGRCRPSKGTARLHSYDLPLAPRMTDPCIFLPAIPLKTRHFSLLSRKPHLPENPISALISFIPLGFPPKNLTSPSHNKTRRYESSGPTTVAPFRDLPSQPRSGRSYGWNHHITMKVTSEKKAAAARANGALSRGPVTTDGKARSSQNALQHGLFSTTVVLATEDPEEFRALLNDYCDYYQPEGRVECDLIYQIAACVWRMRRAYAMETVLLDKAAGAIAYGNSAAEKLVDGYFNVSDSAGAKNLDRLQARLDRTQSRLIHDFFLLRRQAKLRDAADPEPSMQNSRIEPITPCVSSCGAGAPARRAGTPAGACGVEEESPRPACDTLPFMDTADVLARLEKFEGRIPHMYRCTGGEVTVGIGHAIHSAVDAAALTWESGAGDASAGFAAVAAAPKGQVAKTYASLTTCRMGDDAIDALTAADIDKFTAQLRSSLPNFDTYPDPAQAALFDMAYNLGIGGLKKFPHMLAAVDAGDWETAANESHRNGIQDARNAETAALFRQCKG
jgi:GH24 family phage-related lysozyme (muramidase)